MKARLTVSMALAAGIALALVAPLTAHHSFSAEFDANKPVTLEGTITEMKWVNPHAWLHIDVKDETGKITNWAIEFALPQALYRRGWRRTDLPVGAAVTVRGWLAKDGTPTANASNVTLSDGRRLFAGSSGTGAPQEQ
ncbi:MAG: hypothetical protein FJW23_00705 [Acidimicrobiia bacterium]|nr:hypothetical protein [Acidimicrobiia bacterium]